MKKVVVTGAAGFLGSHLAKWHLEAGDSVLGIDDFSSSSGDSRHLEDLRSYERFSFVKESIVKPEAVEAIGAWRYPPSRSARDIDIIYNFACPASPPRYQSQPVHTMLTCVMGTERMLRCARLYDAVLVHASTSEVYGDPDRTPQREDYRGCVNPYGPRSCYDEGKRAAEALCFDHLNTHGTDARLVRIFNTYGPNMDPNDGRVVSNFICQALRKEPLTIYGDGKQTRSLCYVDDLVRGIVALGKLDGNPQTPINLGNPHEMTVWELAQHVLYQVKAFGGGKPTDLDISSMIDARSLPTDDPTQRCPNIHLATVKLGWYPRVELSDGLRKTIKYFRETM